MSRAAFLTDSLDLFLGRRFAHMGAHQYCEHAGKRGDKSMSGARLWAEAETARESDYKAGNVNKLGAELALLHRTATELPNFVPVGTNVIELGPGTLRSFRKKTLPILQTLHSNTCMLVDQSAAFLRAIAESVQTPDLKIVPVEDDFFETHEPYDTSDAPILACAFGGIICNMIAPRGDTLPHDLLTKTLVRFAESIREGWLLIAFDNDENGEDIASYYGKHADFQLNIFDRMAIELPVTGAFDPTAFDYLPEWNPSSHQLAHLAVATRDMDFTLGGQPIHLARGQILHLKNSFKIPQDVFEQCSKDAGLSVTTFWSMDKSLVYLLRK